MNWGLYSYLGAATAYGFFTILLLFSWRASLQGKLLTLVTLVSAVWAALAAAVAVNGISQVEAYKVLDTVRYIVWYVFLLKLFDAAISVSSGYRKFVHRALPVSVAFAGLVLLDDLTVLSGNPLLALIGHVLLSLAGLAILEHIYRNTSKRHRWAIKYLVLGAGAIFVYDLYFYTDTLLFRNVDQELWEARGVIHVVAVPLLAIASVRNQGWSLNVFVSRDIVLGTSAILFGGVFILLMAVAGYYLKEYGGSWGGIGQVVLLSIAILLMATVLFSGQLRAKTRVFLAKHFYRNKYDYRLEWLRLTEQLDRNVDSDDRFKAALIAMANTVEARAGMLWLDDGSSGYTNRSSWNARLDETKLEQTDPLVRFLNVKGYIINIQEVGSRPEVYGDLQLPAWLSHLDRPWLIVPLFGSDALIGFIVLAKPLVARSINWEDRDLLVTAAKQVTSYLVVIMTTDELAQAKQFEVFTRLSAYMVHDLKNIAAELEMVSSNARKHFSNPEFIHDAFETVDHAAMDISRLLEQLRNRKAKADKMIVLDLAELVAKVVESRQRKLPHPSLTVSCSGCHIIADKDRLANVLSHLIDNAQQATAENGSVEVGLKNNGSMLIIEIKDSGAGMDAGFVRERLFKPFDTTKGNAGMGIGMYESREFIRQLGGDIDVQSQPGVGTTISLRIPSSVEQGEQRAPVST